MSHRPSNARPRTRLAAADRREALIATGVELLGQRYYEQVEIEEIAAAAGVSTGLLYHYFPSKRDFYVEVIREAVAEVLRVTAPDPSVPERDRVGAMLRAYVEHLQRRPAGFVAVYRGAIGSDPEVREVIEEYRRTEIRRILGALGTSAEARPDLELMVRGWLGFVAEVSLGWIADPRATPQKLEEVLAGGFSGIFGALHELG